MPNGASAALIVELETKPSGRDVSIGGLPIGERELQFAVHVDLPFPLVFIDDEPQFNAEAWIDGSVRHVVPPASAWAAEVYEIFSQGLHVRTATPSRSTYKSDPERLQRLRDQLAALADDEVSGKWASIDRMFGIWKRNAEMLFELLDRLSADPAFAFAVIGNASPREVRDTANAQIDQFIHNYLGAGNALIHLTRDFMKNFADTHLHTQYLQRSVDARSFSGASFVTDLRNYAMHYDLPHEGHQMSMSRDAPNYEYRITASPASLLRFDGWKSSSKAFIEESGDFVDLSAVLRQQRDHFLAQWNWLLNQRKGLAALDAFIGRELAGEVAWIESAGTQGSPIRTWAIPPQWRP